MIIIYESFENLEEIKKIAIINAGFKVFGENGFKKTSVEEITKEAGISKGSLFYYFDSKKNFYLYLYDYGIKQMMKVLHPPGGYPAYSNKTDFFERLEEARKIKMKYALEYPYFFSFAKRTVIEDLPDLQGELQNRNNHAVEDSSVYFFKNLDTYKFKDGIDPKMVLQLLTWCAEGCTNLLKLTPKLKSTDDNQTFVFDDLTLVYDSYVKLIRDNFYKEEYL